MINLRNVLPNVYKYVGVEPGSELPTLADGGYPMYYLDTENNVLCADCANGNDGFSAPIDRADTNWEDEMWCDHCSNRIESAYGERDED